MGEWLIGLLFPPMLLVPAMGALSRIPCRAGIALEIRRKALHVSIGLAALAFPFLFNSSLVLVLACALVLGWMLAVRRIPKLKSRFGRCLHEARDDSVGELAFTFGLAFLLLQGDGFSVIYVVPLLILTFADAAAAIIGRSFPRGRLGGIATDKTASGCLAFFTVAMFVVAVALQYATDFDILAIAGISVTVALVTAVVEAVSRYGLDNFFVPVSAYLLLIAFGL